MGMSDGSKNWQADPLNSDNNRWDCRMADPTFAVMENGGVYIGYRGTKCCCDNFIGAWGSTGEHELETAGLLHASSPDGQPENWKLSHDEAWPTFLYYDDCGADAIVKRQRPSLVFDHVTGEPSHLITGVASSHHGLEWGDGWTVFQPINK